MHANQKTSHLRVDMDCIVLEKFLRLIRTSHARWDKKIFWKNFYPSCGQGKEKISSEKSRRWHPETRKNCGNSKQAHSWQDHRMEKNKHTYLVSNSCQPWDSGVFVNLRVNPFSKSVFSKCYVLKQSAQQTETKQTVQGSGSFCRLLRMS